MRSRIGELENELIEKTEEFERINSSLSDGFSKEEYDEIKKLPNIKIEGDIKDPLENLKVILEEYDPHPHIFLPLSN